MDVLKLIFDKRLIWKGRLEGKTGYLALVVDADEVIKLIRMFSKQLENLRFCDVPTVIPGITERTVQPLIDLDKLVEAEEWSPNARRAIRVVTRQSAEAFHREYVTAGELCQVHGLHHKQVKSILVGAGVEMAFDQDQVHAMIYDRAKVERAAAGREGFWAYRK